MRVISGEYRGRRLVAPESGVRPTSDMVKEAMFNILQCKQLGNVLDLFAGSGALGVEALSRGADKVVFCDNNPAAIKSIKENLSFADSRYEIFFGDYASCLRKYSTTMFDVILIDPPYSVGLADSALKLITKETLAADGIIIVEHSNDQSPVVPNGLTVKSRRRYGSKALSILEWADEFI